MQQHVGVNTLEYVVVEEGGGGFAHDELLAHDLVVMHLRHDAQLHQQLVQQRKVTVDLQLFRVALGQELQNGFVDAAHVHLVDDVQGSDQRRSQVFDLLLQFQQLGVVPAGG